MSQDSTINKFDVFINFVKLYYTTLMKKPSDLSKSFYSNLSTCGRGKTSNQQSYRSAKGIQEIEKLIEEYHPLSKIKIHTMDWQETINNAILISTFGSCINVGSKDSKLFSHNIFLYPQDKSYFVMNDIMRFIEDNTDDQTQSTDQTSSKSFDSNVEIADDQEDDSLKVSVNPTSSKNADNSNGTSINQKPSSNSSLVYDTNIHSNVQPKNTNIEVNNNPKNKTVPNNITNNGMEDSSHNTNNPKSSSHNPPKGNQKDSSNSPRNNNYKGNNYNPNYGRSGRGNRGSSRGNRYNNN
jgi:hypothetical protein